MSDYLTPEEAIENAPADCEEQDVEGVFGGKVRIKALTAAQTARIRQESVTVAGRSAGIDYSHAERLQFQLAVIQPKMTPEQVRSLYLASGPSFATVTAAIDALSGTKIAAGGAASKEAIEEAEAAFPEHAENGSVRVPASA